MTRRSNSLGALLGALFFLPLLGCRPAGSPIQPGGTVGLPPLGTGECNVARANYGALPRSGAACRTNDDCHDPDPTKDLPPICSPWGRCIDLDLSRPVCGSTQAPPRRSLVKLPPGETGEGCICDRPGVTVPLDGYVSACTQKETLLERGELRVTCLNRCMTTADFEPKGIAPTEGCWNWYVDPLRCTQLGVAHGFLRDKPPFGPEAGSPFPSVPGATSGGDFDVGPLICPFDLTSMGVYVSPTGPPQMGIELRGTRVNEVHTEHGWCRWYGGRVEVAADAEHVSVPFDEFRPKPGERVSVVGDWVADHSTCGSIFSPGADTELHETRMHVGLKADPYGRIDTYHLLTSGFFAEGTLQRDDLTITVPVPPTTQDPKKFNNLECVRTALSFGGCNSPGVRLRVDDNDQAATCTIALHRDDNGPLTPRLCSASSLDNDPSNDPCPCADPENCTARGFDSFTAPGYDRCKPFTRPDGTVGTEIAFAGDIRAEWRDPEDLWECQCACDDPSTPGAFIVAPVQGCAPAATEFEKPEEARIGCAQVCNGGLMCGEGPACRINQCRVHDVKSPRVVALAGCEVPAPPSRVASAGEYRVELNGADSVAELGKVDSSGKFTGNETTSITGKVWLNRQNPTRVEFANIALQATNFEAGGRIVTNSTAFISNRFVGTQQNDGGFEVPIGAAGFGVRSTIDYLPGGTQLRNVGPLAFTFSLPDDHFTLDAIGKNENNDAVRLHLSGTIVNHPPTAVAGPKQVVECQANNSATVTLDASSSKDADPGDLILHYQWFEGQTGLGNKKITSVVAPLGSHVYDLHVYDRDLSSARSQVAVHVQDTTPPSLAITPQEICLWPPDHEFALFRLGKEISFGSMDACDPNKPCVSIVAATADEAVDALGSGATKPDLVTGFTAGCARAERAGTGQDRHYTILVQASDSTNNASTKVIKITVPHDLKSHPKCQRAIGVDGRDPRCLGDPPQRKCALEN